MCLWGWNRMRVCRVYLSKCGDCLYDIISFSKSELWIANWNLFHLFNKIDIHGEEWGAIWLDGLESSYLVIDLFSFVLFCLYNDLMNELFYLELKGHFYFMNTCKCKSYKSI